MSIGYSLVKSWRGGSTVISAGDKIEELTINRKKTITVGKL